jgi:uncharacterized protein (UPF0276 family)
VIGLALHPEAEFLHLARELIEEEVDFFEVAPDMLWRDDRTPAPARELLAQLLERSGKPVVGHGLLLSLGSTGDEERWARQLERIALDQATFGFRHYSDHLGWVAQDGIELGFPVALPFSQAAAEVVGARLQRLAKVVPRVAFENSALLGFLGEPALEPAFLAAVTEASGAGLVLDVHNAYADCLNADLDLGEWLEGIPCERVVELHLSGGSWSEPEWLASGRSLRLDTHDGPIPEPCWRATERLLARCPNLVGLVIERIGLVEADLPAFTAEVRRARELVRRVTPGSAPAHTIRSLPAGPAPTPCARHLLEVLRQDDPPAALAARLVDEEEPEVRVALERLDPDALRLCALTVQRLRFERVLRGDPRLRGEFAEDPEGFAARFQRYASANPPTTPWPSQEAAAFHASS